MSCQGCREASKFILLWLTILGWIFSVVSVAGCSFVQINGLDIGLFQVGEQGGFGCFRYSSDVYSDVDVGTALKTARAFGVLLTLGLSAAMVLVIVVVLFKPNRIMWNCYRVLMSLCFVFNLLTFVAFAECADVNDVQIIFGTEISCTVGGAGVCAILNSWLLLSMSILSYCTPTPEEPFFKNSSMFGTSGNSNNNNGTESIKRTIEETPDGKKITEKVTDASGTTTVTTTFEPNDSEIEGSDVGPTVKTTVTDLPNGKKTVEEDADGNQTITTKIVVMASDNWTQSTAQYTNDSDIVVAAATASPQGYEDSGDAVMAAVVPVPVGASARRSYQIEDEERGMANPYLSSSKQDRTSRQAPAHFSDRQYDEPSGLSSPSSRKSRPKSSKHHGRSRGQAEYYDESKPPSPPQRQRDTSGYVQDSVSSAFTDSNTYDDSYNSSSSMSDNSFMDSSANFDNSFAPNDSTALNGAVGGGERKPKKKKKKKKHHHHHRSDGDHRESRHSKKPKEAGSRDKVNEGENEIGPY